MAEFVMVAKLTDVPAGKGKMVVVNGKEIALFNLNGDIHAIENNCAHQGGPLADGRIDGNTVTCPWHAWKFDITTGESPVVPQAIQKKYKVKVEGEDILVAV